MKKRDTYEAWIEEEERKIRWLISRLATAIELRYYLVFMLAANQRYAQAAEECERILAIAPDNLIARAWADKMLAGRLSALTGRLTRCKRRRRVSFRACAWSWSCTARD